MDPAQVPSFVNIGAYAGRDRLWVGHWPMASEKYSWPESSGERERERESISGILEPGKELQPADALSLSFGPM